MENFLSCLGVPHGINLADGDAGYVALHCGDISSSPKGPLHDAPRKGCSGVGVRLLSAHLHPVIYDFLYKTVQRTTNSYETPYKFNDE
jgi:hypothetical protein